MHNNIVELTDQSFESFLKSAGRPVLVDFWAPWCAPCRAVAPTMEALAKSYEGRAMVAKVNVDSEQQIAGALGIRSIPTVAVFNGEEVVDVRVGALPRHAYEQMLDAALDGSAS
ncbi:MAG: thioredoxin [Candidatus Lambdaproteobacteria bacterium]|nr:thioredoxin [Candidatus Lambdaproteobacteria bacterium]